MLSLKSSRWQSLSHAYGAATDVPRMLEELHGKSASKRSEAWGDIWGALCHQGSVYPATYAAIPYLVELATRTHVTDALRIDCLTFVGAVATSTDAAPVPWDLQDDYSVALAQAEPLVVRTLEAKPSSANTVIYLLQSLAALHGCIRTAKLLEGFADGELIPRCPAEQCGVEMFVTIAGPTMFASLEDPATQQVRERTEIAPPPTHAHAGAWTDADVLPLLVDAAARAGQPELAKIIELSGGVITCPKCRHPFGLWTALLEPTEL